MLIVDIHGILVELRPIRLDHWYQAAEDYRNHEFQPLSYVSVNVFNKWRPCTECLKTADDEYREEVIAAHRLEFDKQWPDANAFKEFGRGSDQVVLTNL